MTLTILKKAPRRAGKKRSFAPGTGILATFVANGDAVQIPVWVRDLASFRRWAHSDEFPEKGRICFLDGEIWVDMSMEQFFTHNQVKSEFSTVINLLVKTERLGRFFPDGMLCTNVDANLSCEPDAGFFSYESLASKRIRLVEGKQGGFVELEGTPDMVLEVVSAGSVTKDLETLHDLYWKAGIPEYWLVDVRGEEVVFEIYRHGTKGFTAGRKNDGWIKSSVFGKSFRLVRRQDPIGNPEFILEVK